MEVTTTIVVRCYYCGHRVPDDLVMVDSYFAGHLVWACSDEMWCAIHYYETSVEQRPALRSTATGERGEAVPLPPRSRRPLLTPTRIAVGACIILAAYLLGRND